MIGIFLNYKTKTNLSFLFDTSVGGISVGVYPPLVTPKLEINKKTKDSHRKSLVAKDHHQKPPVLTCRKNRPVFFHERCFWAFSSPTKTNNQELRWLDFSTFLRSFHHMDLSFILFASVRKPGDSTFCVLFRTFPVRRVEVWNGQIKHVDQVWWCPKTWPLGDVLGDFCQPT